MKRRLVRQGSSTMMISLPSKWIKQNNLNKGSEIDLIEKNNNLIIGTSVKETQEITIKETQENEKDIKNLLTHIYRRGYDKIILEGFKESIKEIKTTVSELLLGFEITELSQNKIVIENISEPTSERYDIMLKKSYEIIEETQKILESSFNSQFSSFEDIKDLRKQQDRFILFCRRLLLKENTGKNPIFQWELLTFLMHIEHSYYYLYEYAQRNKILRSKETEKLILNLKDHFFLFKNAYFNTDISLVHKLNNLKQEYQFGKIISLLEKSKSKDSVILMFIREIYRTIQIGSSAIINNILNHSISE